MTRIASLRELVTITVDVRHAKMIDMTLDIACLQKPLSFRPLETGSVYNFWIELCGRFLLISMGGRRHDPMRGEGPINLNNPICLDSISGEMCLEISLARTSELFSKMAQSRAGHGEKSGR